MKWEEVRKDYPHTWVKLNILNSHIQDDKKVIDDMEVLKIIDSDAEAGKQLGKCLPNEAVYHTYHEKIYFRIKNIFGFRKAR